MNLVNNKFGKRTVYNHVAKLIILLTNFTYRSVSQM